MNTESALLEKWVDSTLDEIPFSVLARQPDGDRAFVAMVRIEGRGDYVEPLGQARFEDLDSAIEAGIAFANGQLRGDDRAAPDQ